MLAFVAGMATLDLSTVLSQLIRREPAPPPAVNFNLAFYTGALDRVLAVSQETMTKRVEAVIKSQRTVGVETNVDNSERKVLEDVSDIFKTLQLEAAAVARLAEPAAPTTFGQEPKATPLRPRAPQVIRWIARNERKYAFLSVKFLRAKVFAGDPEAQQGLQFCIDEGLLKLYDQPNPKKPDHSTKACRLNRDNAQTLEILH